ncbi:hypothetical protein AKJ09_02290 [Labilithrix luteola]|uniref:Uncharacterized protein n=1 Tax=Labilithrix luteola TaxID=1391654 RepID=A0A0K1PQF9_9BACT|nr:hypothetical protein AKJ09_02290 [Labilithrix luteola]
MFALDMTVSFWCDVLAQPIASAPSVSASTPVRNTLAVVIESEADCCAVFMHGR